MTGTKVEETDFRYSGPRPTTRESAIISLADAAEAASRSMQKPTPTRIEALVEDIVTAKLLDGQLDESPLTVADLAAVKVSFVFSLTNMLHGRIAYPTNEDRHQQPTTVSRSGSSKADGADKALDASSGRR